MPLDHLYAMTHTDLVMRVSILEAAANAVVEAWREDNPFIGYAIEQLERVSVSRPTGDDA